jgi:hypothetical protein
MKSFSVVLISAACLGAAACVKTNAQPPGTRGNPMTAPATMQVPGTSGQGILATDGQLTRKEVAAKEEPATLVAADRSRCMVSAARFKDATIGSREICDWRTGGRAP